MRCVKGTTTRPVDVLRTTTSGRCRETFDFRPSRKGPCRFGSTPAAPVVAHTWHGCSAIGAGRWPPRSDRLSIRIYGRAVATPGQRRQSPNASRCFEEAYGTCPSIRSRPGFHHPRRNTGRRFRPIRDLLHVGGVDVLALPASLYLLSRRHGAGGLSPASTWESSSCRALQSRAAASSPADDRDNKDDQEHEKQNPGGLHRMRQIGSTCPGRWPAKQSRDR